MGRLLTRSTQTKLTYSLPAGSTAFGQPSRSRQGGVTALPTTASPSCLPPAIPRGSALSDPGRLRGGSAPCSRTTRAMSESTPAGAGNIPPALSNATDSGDPWINNLVANQHLEHGRYRLRTSSLTRSAMGYSSHLCGPAALTGTARANTTTYDTVPMTPTTGALPPVMLYRSPPLQPSLALGDEQRQMHCSSQLE